jgi:hypothetical protein
VDPGTGVALAGVSTDAHGHVIPFKGPDGITEGWVDFGSGRFKVTTVDSGIFLTPTAGDGRYESGSSKVVYVNPTTGSDSLYQGKTTSTPKATITAALTVLAGGTGRIVLSHGVHDVGNGLSLSGAKCSIVGFGAGMTGTTPDQTVIKASTQSGAVLDFTGYLWPASFEGRVEFGNFAIQGSGVADATKANVGLRNSGSAAGSAYFHDIAITGTGGPCVDFFQAYLCDFHRITAVTPVSAKANDVPYMIWRGCNGNRMTGLGFRSLTSSTDTGPSGALVVTDDGTYQSDENVWTGTWFEFLHLPTNGTYINNKANGQKWRDTYFVDCSKESGATGTSYVTFAPSAFTDSGGNIWDGQVPGKDPAASTSPDTGINVTQSRNRVQGVKGYKGTNVTIGSGVGFTYVDLGGGVSGATDPAVVDNSGLGASNTNVWRDMVNRVQTVGTWQQDEQTVAAGGAGPRFTDPNNSGRGAVWLGNQGHRLLAVAGGVSSMFSDSHNFKNLDGTSNGYVDKFAGWSINPAAGKLGFYAATPVTKPTITGSRGGNAALASVLTQLAALGLITDSTTA